MNTDANETNVCELTDDEIKKISEDKDYDSHTISHLLVDDNEKKTYDPHVQ